MSALVGTNVPIAIFHAGTGNLLSVNLALPKEVPEGVHAALFGRSYGARVTSVAQRLLGRH